MAVRERQTLSLADTLPGRFGVGTVRPGQAAATTAAVPVGRATGSALPAAPAVYVGRVGHKRLLPFRHAFVYRVFCLWLDLDAIPEQAARLRLFSHNRFNLFSFHDRDHGRRDGSPVRPWIERALAARGIDLAGGRIGVLCFPRLFGYVFNPLTLYFCHHGDGSLRAILYEVKNTFGQQHGYLLPVAADHPRGAPVLQTCDKSFHVSPFIGMDATYRFRLAEPDDRLSVTIRESVPAGELLIATLTGRRVPLTDGALARAFITHPLMTVKVIAAIHWQALRLWRKGARLHRRPPPPAEEVSG